MEISIMLLGVFAACCLASVKCQNIDYKGVDQYGKYIYSYQGRDYVVSQQLHDQFRTYPEAAKQRFLIRLQQKLSNRFDPSSSGNDQNSNYDQDRIAFNQQQQQIYNEDAQAQQINTFNKNKQNTAVTFRDPIIQGVNPTFDYFGNKGGPSFLPQNTQSFQRPQSNNGAPTFNPQGLQSSQSLQRPQSNNGAPSYNSQGSQSSQGSNSNLDLPIQKTGYNVPIPRRDDRDRGNRAITEFAWRLFKAANTQSDYVLSPMSPQILLSYLAWVADGRTRDELVAANGFGSPTNIQKTVDSLLREGKKRELQIATAFFVSPEMR